MRVKDRKRSQLEIFGRVAASSQETAALLTFAQPHTIIYAYANQYGEPA